MFEPGLGHCTKAKAHLQLKDSVQPKYLNSRPIAFSRLDTINEELDKLINQGVIKKVDFSEWATPIVVVMKSNDKVRICGDYRLTVNPQLMVQHHPIPRVEELFARMNGCQIFSKLDLADAYLQIELDDASKQLLIINTLKGLYQYQRLLFGPSSAPEIFQKVIDTVVAGMEHTVAYLDDILVGGSTIQEHNQNLLAENRHLEEFGFRLRLPKCEFLKPGVTYLGHLITAKGITALGDRVKAIRDFPRATTVKHLEVFIGKLNYYGKFLPNFSRCTARH